MTNIPMRHLKSVKSTMILYMFVCSLVLLLSKLEWHFKCLIIELNVSLYLSSIIWDDVYVVRIQLVTLKSNESLVDMNWAPRRMRYSTPFEKEIKRTFRIKECVIIPKDIIILVWIS